MKAALFDPRAAHGIAVVPDAPAPRAPRDGEVLVRVHAAGLNPADLKLPRIPVAGWFTRGTGVGFDLAGVVEAAPPGSPFPAGTPVYGAHKGAIAERILVPAAKLAPKPSALTFAQAAALPVAAMTALQGLRRNGVGPGDRVLVVGASGGVGSAGVQVAKALGAAHVTAVCSAGASAALAAQLGADATVDYADPAAMARLGEAPKFSVVLDTVSSPDACDPDYEALLRRCGAVAPGGRYVACTSASALDIVRGMLAASTGWNLQRRGYDFVLCEHHGSDLAALGGWAAEGKLRAVLHPGGGVVPFNQQALDAAYDLLKSRRVKGKLVVDIAGRAGERE